MMRASASAWPCPCPWSSRQPPTGRRARRAQLPLRSSLPVEFGSSSTRDGRSSQQPVRVECPASARRFRLATRRLATALDYYSSHHSCAVRPAKLGEVGVLCCVPSRVWGKQMAPRKITKEEKQLTLYLGFSISCRFFVHIYILFQHAWLKKY